MKKWLTLLLAAFNILLSAQADKKWVVGSSPSILQFENDTTTNYVIDSNRIIYIISTSANICNQTGDLLFFSNGMCLFNRKGDSIENAYGFHPPKLSDYYGVAASNSQLALILPRKNNQYYYFHYSMSDSAFVHNRPFDLLYYSIVDMDMNGGMGKLTSKNNVLLQDTFLDASGLTACKHANGRDWWLLKTQYLKNAFYKYLVTSDSVSGPYYQAIDTTPFGVPTAFGQCKFNQGGDMIASTNFRGGVKVMRFDRCTGEISRWLDLTVPYDSASQYGIGANGISFSASGRFLYANTFKQVYQFDLSDSNVQQTVTKVGDEGMGFSTMFEQSQLGPNGKIYIGNFNGSTNSFSTIEVPEQKGLACNFKYHGDTISGSLAVAGVPNMPNYHLGVLTGSECDTIVSGEQNVKPDELVLKLFPNPTSEVLFINTGYATITDVKIYDLTGKLMVHMPELPKGYIEVSSLADGLYVVEVKTNAGTGQKSWIKMR